MFTSIQAMFSTFFSAFSCFPLSTLPSHLWLRTRSDSVRQVCGLPLENGNMIRFCLGKDTDNNIWKHVANSVFYLTKITHLGGWSPISIRMSLERTVIPSTVLSCIREVRAACSAAWHDTKGVNNIDKRMWLSQISWWKIYCDCELFE